MAPWGSVIPYFFLWGETWRSLTPSRRKTPAPKVTPHPFCLNRLDLEAFMLQLTQDHLLHISADQQQALRSATELDPKELKDLTASAVGWVDLPLNLPARLQGTQATVLHSSRTFEMTSEAEEVALYPSQVTGILYGLPEALALLQSLPLHLPGEQAGMLGDDLRYWCHVSRWSLDLMARGKFVPYLTEAASPLRGQWLPLLDSAHDHQLFQDFLQRMPPICRCYPCAPPTAHPSNSRPMEVPQLLLSSLQAMLDEQIRPCIEEETLQLVRKLGAGEVVETWMATLGQKQVQLDRAAAQTLIPPLQEWIHPLRHVLEQDNAYRPCFQLIPPRSGQGDWELAYFLQASDDAQLLVSADLIWNTPSDVLPYLGRTLENPQELLLEGLGLASRLYPQLEESLQQARPTGHTLNAKQAYDFIKTTAWRLEDSGFGVIMPPSLANREGLASRLGLHVRAESLDLSKAKSLGLESLLQFKWELSIGGQTLSKAEFERLVQLDSPLVDINGEWVELRSQDIKAAQTFFAQRRQHTELSLQDALRIQAGDTLAFEKLPIVNFEASGILDQLLSTLSGNQSFEAVPAPPNFRGTLRPYQARGVGWLKMLEQWGIGACLADDMGLGKTIQMIAFLLLLKNEGRLHGPTLLICPTSVLGNWEREVKRFAPDLRVTVHHGPQRLQGKAFLQRVKSLDLVITSYALAPRDQKHLTALHWEGVVLDEAQNIKNPETKQTQAIRNLESRFRVALTGTPLENRLTELWSILEFLNPGYLGAQNFFQRRFATPIERYGDSASLKTLRALVQPFILRRTKSDRTIIQDLPEKQEMPVFCGLTPEQAALYENTVQTALEAVEASTGIQRKGVILATLTKLKQICNHPAHYLQQSSLNSDKPRSGKLQRLQEMLEELMEEGDRALIFTQFAEWGKLLQQHLTAQFKQDVLLLYGGTPKKAREAMVDRFQHDPQGPRLFILSLKAGGVGLNLTRANHVFHYDRWWNPAVENQATDRVFRIGQTRNVQVHKFVCMGTLEEKIHEQIESKQALAEQVVGAGENWLAKLDTDQLRSLLLLDRAAVIEEDRI
ncbi:DEAD/DEAH box helicase [Lyngbya confervoides BDU141951]|uniref:DEAD/DEAH box helicase n=2 Tax=Lyngbya TaxID=28073 RepID=A0ABD4T2C9_9CYAN|nr:DEAD/DEAH box helicase [Lyngbya confervoides]MCM1982786.1 DEAD/DEAH box helicase [Lyngbya confervoides BDU141951]